jgi:hypothetical protein
MAAVRRSLRFTVLFLVLGSVLFVGVWIGRSGVPDQLPGGPVAAQADPLARLHESGSDEEAEPAADYQLWQELAYLSKLFKRLAYTYRGLEREALGPEGHLIPSSGEIPEAWWLEKCNPEDPPPCEWNVPDFARCEILLAGKVREVFERLGKGIAKADTLMSDPEILKKNPGKTFTFDYTELSVPGEGEDW